MFCPQEAPVVVAEQSNNSVLRGLDLLPGRFLWPRPLVKIYFR